MDGLRAVIALIVAPGLAVAQEDQPFVNNGNVEFSMGADVVTAYYFRGYEQEDSGFILQPYAEVGVGVFEGDGFVSGVTLFAGDWNSFHSEKTLAGPGSTVDVWYESDLYAGVHIDFAQRFTGSISYVGYFYPNDALEPIHELDFKLAFIDGGLYNRTSSDDDTAFALKPHILIAWEVDDQNGDENTYGELGIQPTLTRHLTDAYQATLSFPIKVGVSLDDYYTDADGDNEFFGYASAGVHAQVPLPIPAEYGSWNIHAGVDVLYLNDDAGLDDNGDEWQVIGLLGVGFTY